MGERINYENINVTGSPLIYSITSNFIFEELMQSVNEYCNLEDSDSNNERYLKKKCEKNAE